MSSQKGTFTRWLTMLAIVITLVVVSVELVLLLLSIVTWTELMSLSLAEWPWYCRLFLLAWAIFVSWVVDQAYAGLDAKQASDE